MNRYDKLTQILSKCCEGLKVESGELSLYQDFSFSAKAYDWRLYSRGGSHYLEGKAVHALVEELEKLDLPNTTTSLGINTEGTFRVEVQRYVHYVFIFKLTPLNSHEQLTRLNESFT
jgi:hypothetical protein